MRRLRQMLTALVLSAPLLAAGGCYEYGYYYEDDCGDGYLSDRYGDRPYYRDVSFHYHRYDYDDAPRYRHHHRHYDRGHRGGYRHHGHHHHRRDDCR